MTSHPLTREYFQSAFVVENLEAACHQWSNNFGIGPFFIKDYRPGTFDQVIYRGAPADLSMRVALAQAGTIQIELIEPGPGPSAYRDMVPQGSPPTFHHFCAWTDDFAADQRLLESKGCEAVNIGHSGPVTFGYFDTRETLGCMLEIVTRLPAVEARFAMIADAARDWDGTDPIRE